MQNHIHKNIHTYIHQALSCTYIYVHMHPFPLFPTHAYTPVVPWRRLPQLQWRGWTSHWRGRPSSQGSSPSCCITSTAALCAQKCLRTIRGVRMGVYTCVHNCCTSVQACQCVCACVCCVCVCVCVCIHVTMPAFKHLNTP